MTFIIKLIKESKGQAIILVALIFSVLLGFGALAIDYGYLSLQKRELQNAADAAALAGVIDLSKGNEALIDNTVNNYIEANVTDFENVIIKEMNIHGKNLTVTLEKKYDLFIAKAIGFNTSIVSASATAIWESQVTGDINNPSTGKAYDLSKKILPIGVMEQDVNYGQLGFIGYEGAGGMEEDNAGYFGYLEKKGNKTKIKEYKNKDIQDFFSGSTINYLTIENIDEIYSVEDANQRAEHGLEKRIDDAKNTDDLVEREYIMTAVVPVISLFPSNNSPHRFDDELKKESDGDHYKFNIEYYITVILRDFVEDVDGRVPIGSKKFITFNDDFTPRNKNEYMWSELKPTNEKKRFCNCNLWEENR